MTRLQFLLLSLAAAVAPAIASPGPEPVRIAFIEGLSGPFANVGEAFYRNLLFAVENVNRLGGVQMPGGARPLELQRFDGKNSPENSVAALQSALEKGITLVANGNGSAVATALVDALNRHNQRSPQSRALLLNYAAVDPALTNERCSFWHFRFESNSDMRMAALVDVLRSDGSVKKVYLIGQDYSFGQAFARDARARITVARPDIEIVGDDLHSIGKVADFLPYASKIKSSGAQAVFTGNWGRDLTLLVKALKDAGVTARVYTFYGNSLGAPAAIGESGIGRVLAVAEWHPNMGTPSSRSYHMAFRNRFSAPEDNYQLARTQALVELLKIALERARTTEATAVARALEGLRYEDSALGGLTAGWMRGEDHQFIQPLVVSVMQRAGSVDAPFDNEGSGFGFETVKLFDTRFTALPHRCNMQRP
ncbi:branched-chain amino acid ABC transporter substrate-binding protein [Rhizobacter sp. Root404]|uniref:branched-chain amino acid ABC transporter substrate-binding protein n=1 Tax=Rhizobacter sp. Root404 TaxID=1736528 RepID=UPI0006FE2B2D|nr:branched-chain amino acid ABC transporter substrate-binding protein [Rhizobacter sp. Root404]KQW38415.1 ABC transporter permease [Rhizobacter sp. Root404]